jgi:hypothetical protein
MHLLPLITALIAAMYASTVDAGLLTGYTPVTTIDGPQDQYTIRFTHKDAAIILDGSGTNEPYKVMFNQRLLYSRDVAITDAKTGQSVAQLRGKFKYNPFDWNMRIQFVDTANGNTTPQKGKLDFDLFYIWNVFNVKVSGATYKMMCGRKSTTCNIVEMRRGAADKVVTVLTFGQQMNEYTLTVSRNVPIGVSLLAGVVRSYGWTQRNIYPHGVPGAEKKGFIWSRISQINSLTF